MRDLKILLMDLSSERKFYKHFESECAMLKFRLQLRKYFTNLVEVKEEKTYGFNYECKTR